MIILLTLLYLLCIAYGAYTGQATMALSVIAIYIIVWELLKYCLKPKSDLPLKMYTLFAIIYGTLVLLTQIELIHDPFRDCYAHVDAPGFYRSVMVTVLPCSWSEIYGKTIGSPFFSHYPLAMFLMSVFGKIGMTLGIENLRLFLRIPAAILSAGIIAMTTDLFDKKNVATQKIMALTVCFGMGSFLYITSAVFNRDIYICLVYSIGAYVCLSKDIRHRLLVFIILFFLVRGFRPENGLLFLVYPFAFYFDNLKKRVGYLGIVVIILLGLGILFFSQETIDTNKAALDFYDKRAGQYKGGIFYTLYSLPFPINTIIMIIYVTLLPLPMFDFILTPGCTWLNLPFIISPYLLFFIFAVCIYYCWKVKEQNRQYLMIFLACLFVYSAIVFGSPDLRRAFAPIPGVFMCYGLMENNVPEHVRLKIKRYFWPAIALINAFFVFYVYFRG